MEKKLIFVAAPPACGKTYVSELVAREAQPMVYLDKDDLCHLLRAAFAVAGEGVNMDGNFYLENLRPAEYSTILQIGFSALRYADRVLINAPFGAEVRDPGFMKAMKQKANACGAQLVLIWVMATPELCYRRMKERNSDRDTRKLADWDRYVKTLNFAPPSDLETQCAVDRLIVFDTKDDLTVRSSLEETLRWL